MDSEDLLYLLYTSGTTGEAQGHHAHHRRLPHAGRVHPQVRLRPASRDDVYWCAADIGWVTGHSYIVYGPLANGATSVMYEGTPDTPGRDRFWAIVEKYGVTILYTAPTAIRTFMKWGDAGAREARPVVAAPARHGRRADQPRGVDLVPHAHRRRPLPDRRHVVADRDRRHHDHARCPGATTTEARARPRSRCPASAPRSSTTAATGVERGGGYLTLTRPWPSMLRGIYGDPERYQDTYWSPVRRPLLRRRRRKIDDDGYFWLLGRVDDVMNVSGHRISTTEVESALVDHPKVAEAAVVGAKDDTTGQAIIAFVTVKGGTETTDRARRGAAPARRQEDRPDRPARRRSIFTDDLPKTRSGKIMRRLLRDVAEGRELGDTTTLADPAVVEEIRTRAATAPAEE